MGASSRLALNSLEGRLRRTALLVCAVALSTAMISAVACALATVNATLEDNVRSAMGEADLRITTTRGLDFGDEVLPVLDAWEAVRIAAPRAEGAIPLYNKRALARAVAVGQGVEPARERLLRRLRLTEGREAVADGEIVLDEVLALALYARVGDELVVEKWGDPMTLVVVGVRERPRVGGAQRPEAHVTRTTLDQITGLPGRITSVDIALREGVDAKSVEPPAALPAHLAVQPTERVLSGLERNIQSSRVTFVIASALACIASTFIILTGMTTNLVERRRELAIVRAIGGTRGQLARSQLLVGAIVGVAGAVLGTPLGAALAWLLATIYADRLPAGFHLSPFGLGLAAFGAVAAGLAGALWPAWAAARTSPLASLSARAAPVRVASIGLMALAGLGGIGLQLAVSRGPQDGQVVFWLYMLVGMPALLVGCFLLGPMVVTLLGRVVAGPLERALGLPRGLARGAILATPYRNGFTAGALMVGLGMMVAIWTGGSSVLRDWVDTIRFPDAFAHAWLGMDGAARARVEQLPFVRETAAITLLRTDAATFGVRALNPVGTSFIAFEPRPFFRMTRLEWHEGDEAHALRRLDEGGAILVAREFKVARGLGVGDVFAIPHRGVVHEFEIVGVVGSPGLDIASRFFEIGREQREQSIHAVFGTRSDLIERFGTDTINLLQIDLDPNVSDEHAIAEIRRSLGSSLLVVGSGREIKSQIDAMGARGMRVMSLVAIGAIVIACFGVGSVVVAGIDARRFEFGVLRALGASRGVTARLVLCEVVVIALAACALGTLMGLLHSWAVMRLYRLLAGLELTLQPPIAPILAGCGIVLGLALLAAAAPAVGLARQSPRALLSATRG
ncbi:MAG: ABC transporter permease [Phycisphaerales bacterium]|nr:MAG: ABC transporter permease [Phycisphaerales bacterium]